MVIISAIMLSYAMGLSSVGSRIERKSTTHRKTFLRDLGFELDWEVPGLAQLSGGPDAEDLAVNCKYRAQFMAHKGLMGQLHTVLARQAGIVPDVEWRESLPRMRFTGKRRNLQIVRERTKKSQPPSVHQVREGCTKG